MKLVSMTRMIEQFLYKPVELGVMQDFLSFDAGV